MGSPRELEPQRAGIGGQHGGGVTSRSNENGRGVARRCAATLRRLVQARWSRRTDGAAACRQWWRRRAEKVRAPGAGDLSADAWRWSVRGDSRRKRWRTSSSSANVTRLLRRARGGSLAQRARSREQEAAGAVPVRITDATAADGGRCELATLWGEVQAELRRSRRRKARRTLAVRLTPRARGRRGCCGGTTGATRRSAVRRRGDRISEEGATLGDLWTGAVRDGRSAGEPGCARASNGGKRADARRAAGRRTVDAAFLQAVHAPGLPGACSHEIRVSRKSELRHQARRPVARGSSPGHWRPSCRGATVTIAAKDELEETAGRGASYDLSTAGRWPTGS